MNKCRKPAIIFTAFLVLASAVTASSAVEFIPGDYYLEIFSPAASKGRSKHVLDSRCRPIKSIGPKIVSNSGCAVAATSERGNELSFDLTCDDKDFGKQKLSVNVVVNKDNFKGHVRYEDPALYTEFIGRKVSSCQPAPALPGEATPEKGPETFIEYINDKYQNVDSYSYSDVVQTEYGPSGTISLSGDIVPHKKPAIDLTTQPSREARARAIAKAFLEDEEELFGIVDFREIRERGISTSDKAWGDSTFIGYDRYINGIKLEGAHMQIVIGPSERIKSVQAYLVAVPPEAYERTKQTCLSEDNIKSIIEEDLKQHKVPFNRKTVSLTKIAMPKPPFVVFEAVSVWRYTINAFTGEIIRKLPTIIVN